jgi:spore coat polysaccharide biosynthesis protein SpsF
MRTVAIIQARMGSTRLPGKVMLPLAGRPMLDQVIERVRLSVNIDDVVVATSVRSEDEAIVACCRDSRTEVFRGSVEDVLSRYHRAAIEAKADVVVRITSDCPLISPRVIDRVISAYADGGCDYASNCHQRTFPRGLDVEVLSFAALDAAQREAEEQAEREHVTPFIWRRPQRFRLRDVVDPIDRHQLRWTVDTPEDFELVKRIYSELSGHGAFDYSDVLELLERHPEWSSLNSHVEQKKLGG